LYGGRWRCPLGPESSTLSCTSTPLWNIVKCGSELDAESLRMAIEKAEGKWPLTVGENDRLPLWGNLSLRAQSLTAVSSNKGKKANSGLFISS
jgi:hypothetical protein